MWSDYLTCIGDGSLNGNDGTVELPAELYYDSTKKQYYDSDSLLEFVFPNIKDSDAVFGNSMIITPTNKARRQINRRCIDTMPGQLIKIVGHDECLDKGNKGENVIDIDIMNRTEDPSLPDFCLYLKVGCIVMLLKNLNPPGGLCNGTRIRVTKATALRINGTIIGGRFHGQEVLIPRLKCQLGAKKAGFELCRTQIPVTVAFATTINKSQGQTLDKVGIDLTQGQCFTHGQAYVALSRSKKLQDLRVALPLYKNRGKFQHYNMQNPVFREVLDQMEGGGLSGITSILTEEEKEALRRSMIPDEEYAMKVHEHGPFAHVIPTSQELEDNSPKDGTCGHILVDSAYDTHEVDFLPHMGIEEDNNAMTRYNLPDKIVQQFTTLDNYGNVLHLLHDVLGDGNCFYRAICGALPQLQYDHQTLRCKLYGTQEVPEEMQRMWTNALPEDLSHDGMEFSRIDQWKQHHVNEKIWAEPFNIYWTAAILGIQINVVAWSRLQRKFNLHIINESSTSLLVAWIFNADGNHFLYFDSPPVMSFAPEMIHISSF